MDLLTHRLILTVLIAIGGLWAAGTARAAEATVVYALPSSDSSGISTQTAPGITGCIVGCATLRLVRGVAVPARRQALVAFAAPAGTTIVRGALTLRYRTRQPGVSAHVLARLGGRWIDSRRLRSVAGASATVAAGAGATALAVALTADGAVPARAVKSDQENVVAIEGVALTVRDASAPTVAWTAGDPATGEWQRGALCATASARDAGLGVDRIEYAIGAIVATATAPAGTRLQPRPPVYDANLCVDTNQLADGTYGTQLTAIDTGVGGNRSAAATGLVRVDNTPPTVVYTPPPDPESRFPAIALAVADGASGVARLAATIDGLPATLRSTGGTTTATPVGPLTDGPHRIAWEAADAAGNVTADSETFGVADTTPPSIDALLPQGTATPSAAISAQAADAGSGIAIDGWRLAVDGLDVTGACDVDASGRISYAPPRAWADGDHLVRLTVSDRSGNRSVREWTFTLPVTPPRAPEPAVQPEPAAADAPPPVAASEPAPNGSAAAPTAPPAARIVLRASALRLRAGERVVLRGRVRGTSARRLRLEARVRGDWRLVLRLPIDADGRFATPVRLPSAGRYEVRVRVGRTVSAPLLLVAR